MQQFFFYFVKQFWQTPVHWILTDSTEMLGLHIFVGFKSHPPEHMCLKISIKAISCLSCLISMMLLIQCISVIFCGLTRKPRYLHSTVWQRAGELTQPWGQTINKYCCMLHVNVDCLGSYFIIRMDKNTFTKSMDVYHVPGTLLFCSGRDITSGTAVEIRAITGLSC